MFTAPAPLTVCVSTIPNLRDYDYIIKIQFEHEEQMRMFRAAIGALNIPTEVAPDGKGWYDVLHYGRDAEDIKTILTMLEKRTSKQIFNI